jgi:hypothetical protein
MGKVTGIICNGNDKFPKGHLDKWTSADPVRLFRRIEEPKAAETRRILRAWATKSWREMRAGAVGGNLSRRPKVPNHDKIKGRHDGIRADAASA